jgi:hypothetical protein
MQLPALSDLNEFNRLLSIAEDLSNNTGFCSKNDLIILCSLNVLGGQPCDHYHTLGLCKKAGFIKSNRDILQLTPLGTDFLSHNPSKQYEVTDMQKQFIADSLVFDGAWKQISQKLFMLFDPDYEEVTYFLAIGEKTVPRKHNPILHLATNINIIFRYENGYKVRPQYVSAVRSMRNEAIGVTVDDLDKVLKTKMALAILAENAVVEFEKRRLRQMNMPTQAALVRRVSQLDTKAGYDIQSFDGDKPAFDYDRFIEVKTSQQNEIHFYWTANEKRVAQEKTTAYWIYFIGGLKEGYECDISPIAIQDPVKNIELLNNVDIKVAVYLVEENRNGITTNKVSYGIEKLQLIV